MCLEKIINFIFKKKNIKNETDEYIFYKSLPKRDYPKFLKKIYKQKMGKNLDLRNPKTYTEKIQWLKLYDNIPIKTILSDKLRVRDWVEKKVDNLNFPEIYGIWESFDEIEFDKLPDSFVLKTNHGSAMNMFINDKAEFLKKGKEKIGSLFNNWLNINFAFCYGFELQYRDIPPKVFAEEKLPIIHKCDYCVLCMNGKAKFIEHLVFIRPNYSERVIYDTNWQKQPFTDDHPIYNDELEPPVHLSEMIRTAEILASEFKLVRVDFNEVDEKLYFAEMTFTPCSGNMTYTPEKYDRIIGDMLDLKIKESRKVIL